MILKAILRPFGWKIILLTCFLVAAMPFGKMFSFLLPYMGLPIPFFDLGTFNFIYDPVVGFATYALNVASLYVLTMVSIFIVNRRLKRKIETNMKNFSNRFYYMLFLIGLAGLILTLAISYMEFRSVLDVDSTIIFLILISPSIISFGVTVRQYIKIRKRK